MKRSTLEFFCAWAIAAIALAGCTSAGVTPALSPYGAVASPGSASTRHASAPAIVTIRFPTRTLRLRTHSGFRFISPSASSVVVDTYAGRTQKAGPSAFANAPAKGGATAVRLRVPTGPVTFVVKLYDKPQRTGEKKPAGNEVGAATVTRTIVAQRRNVVPIAVAGVVARALLQAPAVPLVEALPAKPGRAAGFGIVGTAAQTFTVVGVDADGNAIVPAPAATLAPAADSVQFLRVKAAAAPNAFTIQANVPSETPLRIATSVVATATDALGDTVSNAIPVVQRDAIYVAYAGAPAGTPKIALYDGTGKRIDLGTGAFAGANDPVAIAWQGGQSNVAQPAQALFVADAGGSVLAFDAAGNPLSGYTAPLVNAPSAIAYYNTKPLIFTGSSNGVAEYDAQTGAAIAVSGLPATAVTALAAFQGPSQTDPAYAGIAYVATAASNLVQTFGTNGSATGTIAAAGLSAVTAMAIDNDGLVLFALGAPSASGGANICSYPAIPTASVSMPCTQVAGASALAYDVTSHTLRVATASGSILDLPENLSRTRRSATIQTPASSGLETPLAIAVAY